MSEPRIGIFADVQNVYYTTRDRYGRPFDYGGLWREVAYSGSIELATAFAIDRGDAQQQKFQSALSHIGFEVKLKPYIQRRDGSAKGDWDVGLTIDVLEAAPTLDEIVLLSGDGDFDVLLEKIRSGFGVSSTVYGVPGLTARSLIDAANRYIPITEAYLL